MEKKVWYVAGASKGLGLALTHQLLTKGYRVAATSRLLPALVEATGGNTLKDFLPLEVDGSDQRSIADSIRTTWESFGRLDVVVNNASMCTSVYTVVPKAIPYLHQQGHGHIIDIAPIAGPADTGHTGSDDEKQSGGSDEKHAAGIRRTTVVFGAFRTRLLNDEPRTPQAMYVSIDGRQLADPKKTASALIRLPALTEPPALLVLDSDAYRRSTAKMADFDVQLESDRRTLCRVSR